MGADLVTLNELWSALYHDAGNIKDKEPREGLKKLLEKKLFEMNKIDESEASEGSKRAQCCVLEKELLEIKQEIAKYF